MGRTSVGKGGKDSVHSPPIAQYRKEIGKQDWKKEKKNQRQLIREAEAKDNAPKAIKQSVSFALIFPRIQWMRSSSLVMLQVFSLLSAKTS